MYLLFLAKMKMLKEILNLQGYEMKKIKQILTAEQQ